jgi:hypothetical protein
LSLQRRGTAAASRGICKLGEIIPEWRRHYLATVGAIIPEYPAAVCPGNQHAVLAQRP